MAVNVTSEVLVGRRYLERGFVDTALRLFVRNAAHVETADWLLLVERLMERNRVADVVRVCELGDVPLPRERLLALGDAALRRRDVDGAKTLYELADADRERWAAFVDVLSALPERERLALSLAERYLVPPPVVVPVVAALL
ncbi:MAG TPA: hypothetical protein VGR62_13340 [Candidatus Binatia bacterium]|nr:hypothetical protein [Candidatus Binatia bacterium]